MRSFTSSTRGCSSVNLVRRSSSEVSSCVSWPRSRWMSADGGGAGAFAARGAAAGCRRWLSAFSRRAVSRVWIILRLLSISASALSVWESWATVAWLRSGTLMPPWVALKLRIESSLAFRLRLTSASWCSRNSRDVRASSTLNDRVRASSTST
jgi:hypothetical protein